MAGPSVPLTDSDEEREPLLPQLIRMSSPVEGDWKQHDDPVYQEVTKGGESARYSSVDEEKGVAGCEEMDTSGLKKMNSRSVICVNDGCSTDVIHCHEREVHGDVDRVARRKLIVAILLVFVFMIVEICGRVAYCVVFD